MTTGILPRVAEPYTQVTDRVASDTDAHPLTEPEATALLALARRVAHTSDDRRAAPLVCYLLGQLTADEEDGETRVRLIEELAARLFPEP
jgi:hypothetical protein